jgi:SAM-dependent methyltransferase
VTFKDHFSGHAEAYAAARPTHYPPALFDFLASLTAGRRLAWDCATGNGQAALPLAGIWERVIATDASAEQIAHALPHPRVEYRVAPAESSGLAERSIDLVNVAQAAHWLDFDRFYAEVLRVLVPGGAVALWTYNLARVTPELDRSIDRLAKEIVGPWWPPERRWVDEEYRTLPFPFAEVPAPAFELVERWDLAGFVRYLKTWSAATRYRRETGKDAVDELHGELARAWGDPAAPRDIRWPLYVRAGRAGRVAR